MDRFRVDRLCMFAGLAVDSHKVGAEALGTILGRDELTFNTAIGAMSEQKRRHVKSDLKTTLVASYISTVTDGVQS